MFSFFMEGKKEGDGCHPSAEARMASGGESEEGRRRARVMNESSQMKPNAKRYKTHEMKVEEHDLRDIETIRYNRSRILFRRIMQRKPRMSTGQNQRQQQEALKAVPIRRGPDAAIRFQDHTVEYKLPCELGISNSRNRFPNLCDALIHGPSVISRAQQGLIKGWQYHNVYKSKDSQGLVRRSCCPTSRESEDERAQR